MVLAEFLKNNSTLQVLHLSGNSISNKRTEAFADALKVNTGLNLSNLYCNCTDDEGELEFANALTVNSSQTDEA